MVILSDNPYEVEPEKLKDIKVENPILSGRSYKSADIPFGKYIWRGPFSKNRYQSINDRTHIPFPRKSLTASLTV